jgi:excinuclease ABC subunit C
MTLEEYRQYQLPDSPGIYRFVDAVGGILYIGRATSLKSRVRSYFSPDLIDERGVHFIDMVTRSQKIEWTETASLLESVLLEASLIKKFQPYYNTKEKDNKSALSVVVTDEAFPRVFLERSRTLDTDQGLSYKILATFGPFPHGPTIREALRVLRKLFPFRSGKTKNKERDRFYESLGLSSMQNDSAKTMHLYNTMIQDLMRVLSGDQAGLLIELENRMKEYAKTEQYELAASVRNTLWSLNHIRDIGLMKVEEKQRGIESVRIEAYDVAHTMGSSMVGVMVVLENGEPQPQEYRKFIIRGITSSNDPAALLQILTRRMRHREWSFPNIIVTDGNEVQMNVAEHVVSEMKKTITIVSVVKDEKHNARDILGDKRIVESWREAILLANREAHRYAISFHRERRGKAFLPAAKTPKPKPKP